MKYLCNPHVTSLYYGRFTVYNEELKQRDRLKCLYFIYTVFQRNFYSLFCTLVYIYLTFHQYTKILFSHNF